MRPALARTCRGVSSARPFGAAIHSGTGALHYAEARKPGIAAGAKDVRIVLPRAAEIRGTVLGPDERPLAAAAILTADYADDLWSKGGSVWEM
ncbi:MAG: hypothetical protein AAB114_01500, partial [Chloroflexota bacterium]